MQNRGDRISTLGIMEHMNYLLQLAVIASLSLATLAEWKHPLKPLDASEITATSSFILGRHPEIKTILFISIDLLDPAKHVLAPFLESLADSPEIVGGRPHSIPRESHAVLLDAETGETYEVIVSLQPSVSEVSFQKQPTGVQPLCSTYEEGLTGTIVRSDPTVVKRLNDLGFTDLKLIEAHPWVTQLEDNSNFRQNRMIQAFLYFHEFHEDNELEHPLNFVPVVDIIAKKVVFIQELPLYANSTTLPAGELVNLPFKESKYLNATVPPKSRDKFYRNDSKPVHVEMPKGRSFIASDDGGWGISWQKFSLRIGFNSRVGLVLYDVYYKDTDKRKITRRRPLLYRASVAEMIVPYGDPRPPYHYKRVMDFGSYGAGFNANPLEFGVDCFPHGHLIDAYLTDEKGQPKFFPRVICVQEEDAGLLHKHSVNNTIRTVARAVHLSIHMMLTVGNYDYLVIWRLGQDAAITLEVKLTGILSTNLVAEDVKKVPYGTILAPQLLAQNHQHLFSARLDVQIDGERNTVSTVDIHPIPTVDDEDGSGEPKFSEEDPSGHGFIVNETVLETEQDGITDTSLETERIWVISNPGSVNDVTGEPVSWKLIPQKARLLLAKPGSFSWKTARFAAHAVWVTKYHDGELFPAGKYVGQLQKDHPDGDGLPVYVEDDENIQNEDIVLWHTFGVTHIPRLEDFPIMAAESTGFTLKPRNFFNSYPGLDVPPPSPS